MYQILILKYQKVYSQSKFIINHLIFIFEGQKHYWIHNLPIVTKQTDPKLLIPSLLFCDNEYAYDKEFNIPETSKETNLYQYNTKPTINIIKEEVLMKDNGTVLNEMVDEKVDNVGKLMTEIDMQKNILNTYVQEHKNKEINLANVRVLN